MSKQKITDEQILEELLENNKTLEQLAKDRNMSKSNLSNRVKSLGLKRLNKVYSQDYGRIVRAKIDEELEEIGADPENDQLYFDTNVENGSIVLDVYKCKWKKEPGLSKRNEDYYGN